MSSRPSPVPINPARIGPGHAILWGRGRRHHVDDFPGPLSIKSVVRGTAVWETRGGRFVLEPGSWLVLNAGRPYTIDVDSPDPVETLCVFFRGGFVGDVARASVTSDDRLLETPERQGPEAEFLETIRNGEPAVESALAAIRTAIVAGTAAGLWLEEALHCLARLLLAANEDFDRAAARVPAARVSTRREIFRRIRRAIDRIESAIDEPLDLAEIARAACLSPYHFHRQFAAVVGETPHRYVVRRRLERARRLLTRSDLPVTHVSLACGFESPGSFSSLFRRRFGVSPRTFRAEIGGSPGEKGKNGEASGGRPGDDRDGG